jgi:hypothetical protein
MKPPTYAWVCHVCGSTNQPNTIECEECKFPAIASANEIDKKKGASPNPDSNRLGIEIVFLLIAAPVMLILKFWFISAPAWIAIPVGAVGIALWLFEKIEGKK